MLILLARPNATKLGQPISGRVIVPTVNMLFTHQMGSDLVPSNLPTKTYKIVQVL